MALPHAILVSLSEQSGSGYELASRFDRSIGYFWRRRPDPRHAARAHVTPRSRAATRRADAEIWMHRTGSSGREIVTERPLP
ncbi:hypothetical protein MCHIJ_26490 [Mycolicibacterium chitae]|nr:hypothetical protein MCHIJ_26490 [Mycolicibacterium chitae]